MCCNAVSQRTPSQFPGLKSTPSSATVFRGSKMLEQKICTAALDTHRFQSDHTVRPVCSNAVSQRTPSQWIPDGLSQHLPSLEFSRGSLSAWSKMLDQPWTTTSSNLITHVHSKTLVEQCSFSTDTFSVVSWTQPYLLKSGQHFLQLQFPREPPTSYVVEDAGADNLQSSVGYPQLPI